MTFVDKHSVFGEYNTLYARTTVIKSRVGRFTYIGDAKIINSDIGSFCSIGVDVLIGGFYRHPVRWLSTHPAFFSTRKQCGHTFVYADKLNESAEGCRIGHDTWIGSRAMVMDGVVVGNGAIIAAGAVVTKNVEDYSIVAGVPAKPIGSRFAPDVIEILQDWKWWDLSADTLSRIAPHFSRQETWTVDDLRKVIGEVENADRIDA